jgi:prophage tail gpP-like protein
MKRPNDTIKLEALQGEAFDRFTTVEATNDLTAPSEASVECGDDGTWNALNAYLSLGSKFRLIVNGRLRLTGRLEAADCPVDATNGATVRFLVRTKLADATFASALPAISVQNATLKQVVLKAYASLGYREKDFIFKADVARDLMTGKPAKGGKKATTKLEPIKLEQARVNPPETIYEFVERHLLRFHLSHWDSPDGKIVVGAPDDTQSPLYRFVCKRPAGRFNNVLAVRRVRDASDSPSMVGVFGAYQASEWAKAKVARVIEVPEIVEAQLYRPVLFVDHQIQTREQADAKTRREIVHRVKKLDSWEVHTDGWSYWDGNTATPYGVDTVADVDVDVASGAAAGPYLVHRVHLSRTAEQGDLCDLTLIRRGLWRL